MTKSLVVFVAVLMTAVAQSADEAKIRAARERSNQGLARHDIRMFGESLAPDFVMVRGNGTFVGSRREYIEVIAGDFKQADAVRYERIADRVEISSAAPVAAEHGHWVAILPNGKRAYTGTYLAMWKRAGAEWKLRSELFVVLGCEDEAVCAGYRK